MSRPLAAIDAQIAVMEAQLATATGGGVFAGITDGSTNAQYRSINEIMQVLDRLYAIRARLDGSRPMFARGRLIGGPLGSSTSGTFQ